MFPKLSTFFHKFPRTFYGFLKFSTICFEFFTKFSKILYEVKKIIQSIKNLSRIYFDKDSEKCLQTLRKIGEYFLKN